MSEEQENTRIWRLIAVFSLLLVCIITIGDFLKYCRVGMSPVFIVSFLVANAIVAIILVYFIFKPSNYIAYILFSFAYGNANLLRGGSIVGFLLFLLCAAFLYKHGFLQYNKKIKVTLLFLYVAMLIVLQLRFSLIKLCNTVLNISAVILFIAVLIYLFTDEIRRYMEASANRVIDLCDMGFSARDVDCLQRVLNSEKYETLARDYNVSLSTIKHRMKKLFRSLGVCDRIEFFARYAGVKIIWKKNT